MTTFITLYNTKFELLNTNRHTCTLVRQSNTWMHPLKKSQPNYFIGEKIYLRIIIYFQTYYTNLFKFIIYF